MGGVREPLAVPVRGQYESAGYRAIAGETLAYFHQRVREEHGQDTAALAMGDFNDEPFDTSLVAHALSTRQAVRVINADTPRFWNLMWPAAGTPEGTFYFQNEPNLLDQFLVNANMARPTSPLHANPDSVRILRFPELVHTGDYPRPRPFGGMGAAVDETGYSDHFPIGMTVTEID